LKPDCRCALQRKECESLPAGFSGTVSPVRFDGKTCGIAAISRDFRSNAAEFSLHPRLCGGESGILHGNFRHVIANRSVPAKPQDCERLGAYHNCHHPPHQPLWISRFCRLLVWMVWVVASGNVLDSDPTARRRTRLRDSTRQQPELLRSRGVGGPNPLSPTNYSQAAHWISDDPKFRISSIWVRLGPVSKSSTFCTASFAPAGNECK